MGGRHELENPPHSLLRHVMAGGWEALVVTRDVIASGNSFMVRYRSDRTTEAPKEGIDYDGAG